MVLVVELEVLDLAGAAVEGEEDVAVGASAELVTRRHMDLAILFGACRRRTPRARSNRRVASERAFAVGMPREVATNRVYPHQIGRVERCTCNECWPPMSSVGVKE